MMLIHLTGSRRRTVAQSMLAALVATWLSVVCQQCQAYALDAQTPPGDSGSSAHCMVSTDEGAVPTTGQSFCAPGCDCSAMVAVSTVNPPKFLLLASVFDPFAAPPALITHVAFAVPGSQVALPKAPDGVTPPLLERFCIRLE